jgi:hypothetical protein
VWEGGDLVGHASLVQRRLPQAAGHCAPVTWRPWAYAPAAGGAATGPR